MNSMIINKQLTIYFKFPGIKSWCIVISTWSKNYATGNTI